MRIAHYSLAYVLRYAGLLDQAQKECDAAVAIDPENYNWRSCSFAFFEAGKTACAMQYLNKDAGSEWSNAVMVSVLMREGRMKEARQAAQKMTANPTWMREFLQGCLNKAPAAEIHRLAEPAQNDLLPEQDSELKYYQGTLLAACGEKKIAYVFLRKAVEQKYCAAAGAAGGSAAGGRSRRCRIPGDCAGGGRVPEEIRGGGREWHVVGSRCDGGAVEIRTHFSRAAQRGRQGPASNRSRSRIYLLLSSWKLHHMGMFADFEQNRWGCSAWGLGARLATALVLAALLSAPNRCRRLLAHRPATKAAVDHYYEPLPQETGAAGLKLMLRRLQTTGRLMQVDGASG